MSLVLVFSSELAISLVQLSIKTEGRGQQLARHSRKSLHQSAGLQEIVTGLIAPCLYAKLG